MNNSDRIYIANGWVLFGRSHAVPLDAISAIYIYDQGEFDGGRFELRVERRGMEYADLTVFTGSEGECRNRMGQFGNQLLSEGGADR